VSSGANVTRPSRQKREASEAWRDAGSFRWQGIGSRTDPNPCISLASLHEFEGAFPNTFRVKKQLISTLRLVISLLK